MRVLRCALAAIACYLVAAIAYFQPSARSQLLYLPAPPPPVGSYTGLVGTRGRAPQALNPQILGSNVLSFNTRTPFYTMQQVCALQLAFPNFYVAGADEQGSGGTLTLTASVEYPAGTFNQVKWSAATSVAAANASIVTSDSLTLGTCIPASTRAYVRTHGETSVAVPFVNNHCSSDAFEGSTTAMGLPDRTLGGTVSGNFIAYYGPIAIIGTTTAHSLVIWGDSIADGSGVQPYDAQCNVGPPQQGLGTTWPYMQFSKSGDTMSGTVTGSNAALRKTLLQYSDVTVNQLGSNDFIGVSSVTTMLANAQTMAGWSTTANASAKYYHGTITPRVTTNDACASSNQTPNPAYATKAVPFNDALRSGQSWLTGYFDPANQVALAQDSGFWNYNLGSLCVDGIHPNAAGAGLMKNGFSPSTIH